MKFFEDICLVVGAAVSFLFFCVRHPLRCLDRYFGSGYKYGDHQWKGRSVLSSLR